MGLYDRDYMHEHWEKTGVLPPTKQPPRRAAAAPQRQGPPEPSAAVWLLLLLGLTAGLVAVMALTGYDFVGLVRWLLEPVAALIR